MAEMLQMVCLPRLRGLGLGAKLVGHRSALDKACRESGWLAPVEPCTIGDKGGHDQLPNLRLCSELMCAHVRRLTPVVLHSLWASLAVVRGKLIRLANVSCRGIANVFPM
jgi:hypothetical protein